jgi:hypothetical protein
VIAHYGFNQRISVAMLRIEHGIKFLNFAAEELAQNQLRAVVSVHLGSFRAWILSHLIISSAALTHVQFILFSNLTLH